MNRLLSMTVVLLLLSASAFAAPSKTTVPVGDGPTSSYCEAAECGSLPTGESGSVPDIYAGCGDKPTDCGTCINRCNCGYQEAQKKCKYRWYCTQTQKANLHACYGECAGDYPGCEPPEQEPE